jgi:hypothetical protein
MSRSVIPTRWLVVLLVVVVSLLGPVAAASGQTSAGSQYTGNLGQTAHGGQSGGAGTLPFTGLDLGAVAGGGIALVAAGIVLRRRTAHI